MKQSLIEAVKLAFWDEWPCSCETQTYCRALSPHEVDEPTIDACFQAAILAFLKACESEAVIDICADAARHWVSEQSEAAASRAVLRALADIAGGGT